MIPISGGQPVVLSFIVNKNQSSLQVLTQDRQKDSHRPTQITLSSVRRHQAQIASALFGSCDRIPS